MRTRVLLFCVIILAFCLWLLLHRETQIKGGSLEVLATLTNQQSVSQPAQSPIPKNSQVANTPMALNVLPTKTSSQPTPDARSQQALAPWYTPIEFYGKVIDENSNPVAGASVHFRWATQTEDIAATTSITESDADGLFSLQGKHGRSLDVSVSKDGYYNSRKDKTGFLYALGSDIYSPSMINPVVFHLRKKGKGESLIVTDFPVGMGQIAQLHHDGTPVEVDLLKDDQVPAGNGQLKLEFLRDITNINKQPFDWKLQLSLLGGGLIPTDEEFAYQAPASGYQSSIVIDMAATNQNWLGEVRSKYYIQLSDGKYGRIDFYLLPRNGVFTIHSAINPSGSRNLEPQ